MDPPSFFNSCVLILNILSIPTYLSCRYTTAPYGRHIRTGWGPTLPSWLSWFLMESPTVFLTLPLYSLGRYATTLPSLALLSTFLLHYLHRTLIYPLRLLNTPTTSPTRFPLSVSLMAFLFNLLNSFVQARSISHYANFSDVGPLLFWSRFAAGAVMFVTGMVLNVGADRELLRLKRQGGGHKIPRGGWFELVSCPNYFGEMVEWFGWAVMTWSWSGVGFFLYTCANLVPRGRANHKWYLEKFGEDYPKYRKAVIPFLY